MKDRSQTISVIFTLLTLTSGIGCASIAKNLPAWITGDSTASKDEADTSDDPVAAAAMRMRRPASSRLSADEEAASGRAWNRRYSPPVSDTVSYGMDMNDVTSVWGDPASVDTAGDPRDGNQRWVYYSGLSSRYGMGSKRTVYFENGHVVGWKN